MKDLIGKYTSQQLALLAFAREVKNEGYDKSVKKSIIIKDGFYLLYVIID